MYTYAYVYMFLYISVYIFAYMCVCILPQLYHAYLHMTFSMRLSVVPYTHICKMYTSAHLYIFVYIFVYHIRIHICSHICVHIATAVSCIYTHDVQHAIERRSTGIYLCTWNIHIFFCEYQKFVNICVYETTYLCVWNDA